MNAKEVKEYIIEKELLEDFLHKIGCHKVTSYANEIRCALPNDDDPSKVSVSPDDNLSVRIFTKGETIYGSIFDLIMFIDKSSFPEAIKKSKSILGLKSGFTKIENKVDHLQFFKGIKNKSKKRINENKDMKCYDISILDKYSSTPHVDLIRKDGIISQETIDKYYIKFDERTERIVFPHFYHADKTKVVGLMGRTVVKSHESLGIPKYFPVDGYKHEKSKNIYGLSHNLDEIKKYGYCIIFEAEKSVIKADMMGFPVGVAVSSHEISSYQRKLLISLDVEIIIAFDKDVLDSHIEKICNEFNKYRTVSYIKDKWNLLKEKDSPVDRGLRKFKFLFKHRIKC